MKNKLLIFTILFLLIACTNKELITVRQMKVNNVNLSSLENGLYFGDFTYGNFTYKVEVSLYDHKIKDIKILTNRDTKHAKKAEGVIERIIAHQNPNVDAVTGATTTSKALMKAVEKALTK